MRKIKIKISILNSFRPPKQSLHRLEVMTKGKERVAFLDNHPKELTKVPPNIPNNQKSNQSREKIPSISSQIRN